MLNIELEAMRRESVLTSRSFLALKWRYWITLQKHKINTSLTLQKNYNSTTLTLGKYYRNATNTN